MAVHLIDLAPELQITITTALLSEIHADEISDDIDDTSNLNEEDPDENLKCKERESYDNRMRDLMNWSCTSRFFRELLAPYIFHSIRLRNTDRSGSSVYAISQSQHRRHVKELLYAGNAPGDAHKGEESYSNIKRILPKSVSSILSGLGGLPNLENLSIEFPYDDTVYNEWDFLFGEFGQAEIDKEVQVAEETVAWRAVIAKTWNALLKNEDISVKSLNIKNLAPINVSTFKDPAFHVWLGKFESFTLSIYGHANGADWNINKEVCYIRTMSRLDGYFFNHLTSVTHLVVKAPSEGPLGLTGESHIPLVLYKDQMPSLKNLRLQYIFVSPELIDFLLGHGKTLESLSMQNCSADLDGYADDGVPWYHFFDALYNADFTKLSNLEILPHNAPLVDETDYISTEDFSAEVKEACRNLQDDPGRRSFMYTRLEPKYGMLHVVEEENLSAFQRGQDQASYDRLMEKIKTNHAKV